MKNENKQKIIRLIITILILVLICLAIYLPLELSGTLSKIDSAEKLKDVILSGGAYSYLIFFTIQFLQVTFLPIPAFVTTVAGSLVFGPWITSLISLAAVLLASIFAFYLGRKVGRKLINWIVGEKEATKWAEKLAKGKYVFFLMMIFPVFPDDILCLIVGATAMSFKFFIITNLIARPIAIFTTCFIGSGQLIPFSGWGIPVWIVLIVIMAILFYVSVKYQQQIENWVVKLGEKLNLKKQLLKVNTKENLEVNNVKEELNAEQTEVNDNINETDNKKE